MHDWETLAEAVRLLVAGSRGRLGIVVATTGPGEQHLRKAWAGLPQDVVRFERPLGDRDWARLLRRIDVSLVSLKEEARHTSIPSKTFSAMASGSAIAAIAPRDSDVADVVLEHTCGLVLVPGDPQGAASALGGLLEDRPRLEALRAAARGAASRRYDLAALAGGWAAFLDEAGGRRRAPGGGRFLVFRCPD